MKMIDDFAGRLKIAARAIGWFSEDRFNLASKSFRGRFDESEVSLPSHIRGIQLGVYPVLIGSLSFDESESFILKIRKLHNQMLIARSYMEAGEVIDAHIFLVCDELPEKSEHFSKIHEIERNEAVCRKLVWIRDTENIEISFNKFVERTFLAHPWTNDTNLNQAPLDQNANVIYEVLMSKGMTAKQVDSWIAAATETKDDSARLVETLVDILEAEE